MHLNAPVVVALVVHGGDECFSVVEERTK